MDIEVAAGPALSRDRRTAHDERAGHEATMTGRIAVGA